MGKRKILGNNSSKSISTPLSDHEDPSSSDDIKKVHDSKVAMTKDMLHPKDEPVNSEIQAERILDSVFNDSLMDLHDDKYTHPPSPITSAIALSIALPFIWFGVSWVLYQFHINNVTGSYLIPLLKSSISPIIMSLSISYSTVQSRDIPSLCILIHAALAYIIGPSLTMISQVGSGDSYNLAHPRTQPYTPTLAGRIRAASENAMESFQLTLAASLLSNHHSVPLSLRSQFLTLSILSRIAHFVFYVCNYDFSRLLDWVASVVPLMALLVCSAFPKVSQYLLNTLGSW